MHMYTQYTHKHSPSVSLIYSVGGFNKVVQWSEASPLAGVSLLPWQTFSNLLVYHLKIDVVGLDLYIFRWSKFPKAFTNDSICAKHKNISFSRVHAGCSQSSDYSSEASFPDSLSRSISSSNVSEVGIEGDLTELEDAEMLSSFQSTRGKCECVCLSVCAVC